MQVDAREKRIRPYVCVCVRVQVKIPDASQPEASLFIYFPRMLSVFSFVENRKDFSIRLMESLASHANNMNLLLTSSIP